MDSPSLDPNINNKRAVVGTVTCCRELKDSHSPSFSSSHLLDLKRKSLKCGEICSGTHLICHESEDPAFNKKSNYSLNGDEATWEGW